MDLGPDPAALSAPTVPEQLAGPGMGANNALLAQQQRAQAMIKQLLLQRMMQSGGGMQQQPLPQMLGMPPPRPVPQMIPGQIPAGMSGARG